MHVFGRKSTVQHTKAFTMRMLIAFSLMSVCFSDMRFFERFDAKADVNKILED